MTDPPVPTGWHPGLRRLLERSRVDTEMRNYAYEAVDSALWGAETVFRANQPTKESARS